MGIIPIKKKRKMKQEEKEKTSVYNSGPRPREDKKQKGDLGSQSLRLQCDMEEYFLTGVLHCAEVARSQHPRHGESLPQVCLRRAEEKRNV